MISKRRWGISSLPAVLALGALILLTLGPPAAGQTPEPDQGDPGADGPGIIDTSGSNGQSGSSGNKGASRRGATSSSLPGASGFSPGGDDSESGSETKSAGSSAAARRASRAVGEGSTAVPVILLPALPPVIELSGGTAETARESLSNPGSGQTRTQSRGPSWIGLIPVLGALILGYLLYRNPRTG